MSNLSNNPLEDSSEACGGDPHELLSGTERRWLEFEPIFLSHGYRLGGRLAPDWVPSWWKNPDLNPYEQIDFCNRLSVIGYIDAYRVKDGSLVAIQDFFLTPYSLGILSFLNSPELRDDPRNRTIPLLDSFPHPSRSEIYFIVTPLLRRISSPPFDFVGEVMDCIDQLLEGLVFSHENGIFHGHINSYHVAMNDSMFPKGVHPHHDDYLPDGKTKSRQISRLEGKAKYYYLQFQSSGYVDPDGPSVIVLPPSWVIRAPESSHTLPVNPFKLDVFLFGKFIQDSICVRYTNLGFLHPLVDRMTVNNPEYRPTAQQALETWREIRSGVWKIQAAWRVHSRLEGIISTTVVDSVSAVSSLAKWINPLCNA